MKTTPDWQFASTTSVAGPGKLALLAKVALVLGLLNLVVLAAAPAARMYLGIEPLLAFRTYFYSVLTGLTVAAGALIVVLIALLLKDGDALRRAGMCLVVGLLPIGVSVAMVGIGGLRAPMIHNISTDRLDPPQFQLAIKLRGPGHNDLSYSPAIADKQAAAYPDIQPLISDLAPQRALSTTVDVMSSLNWTIVNADFEAGVVEAHETTRVFGFVDDVVVRVRAAGTGSRIDMRSVSRVGRSDMGKNAARIREFQRAFQRLAPLP